MNIKTFVINLDHRTDRWNNFLSQKEPRFLNYNRYSAVNGYNLSNKSSRLQKIFEKNDFNMRKGMVGCALSHIKLYIDLLNDPKNDLYVIFEDDITFVPEFESKLKHVLTELTRNDWDIFYLGHHVWEGQIDDNTYNKNVYPTIYKLNRMESLIKSMGGTFAYMISKKGAEKLLNFINFNGMTNAIDTVQQKSGDFLNLYYSSTNLVYSDVFNINKNIDTDIQKNYESLSMNFDQKLNMELNSYTNIKQVFNLDSIPNKIAMFIYYSSDDERKIQNLSSNCPHLNYTIDDRVIFLCPIDNGKYFHMFKKYEKWNIDDAILFE
jgi:GR25 family glycosyltransferase involved in LPS biosynthesis